MLFLYLRCGSICYNNKGILRNQCTAVLDISTESNDKTLNMKFCRRNFCVNSCGLWCMSSLSHKEASFLRQNKKITNTQKNVNPRKENIYQPRKSSMYEYS